MLRACRRLLRPGGRTAFFTIFVARGLSAPEHRRAVRLGPRAVASRESPEELLHKAGFAEVEEFDVTPEYLRTAEDWLEGSWSLEDGLREVLGSAEFDELQTERRQAISAIREGLLCRSLCVGTRAAQTLDGR